MQAVTLVVQHPCPLARPVQQTAGSRATHLFHRGRKVVLEVHANTPADLERLLTAYRRLGGRLLVRDPDRPAALVRFLSCGCCRSGRVISTIERCGHQYLAPARYAADGERYQFLVLDRLFDRKVLESLPRGVNVVRLRTSSVSDLGFEGRLLVPVGALFLGVTRRQRAALREAIVRRYYQIPRGVRSRDLARQFGISRPAFDKLLRKAESRLLWAVLPYIAVDARERSAR